LYPVQMFPQPDGVEAAARDMRRNRPPAEVAAMADEIALELDQPTQQVRDILGCAASEESCRAFLAGVVRELRKAM
jgi:hypothetical protein